MVSLSRKPKQQTTEIPKKKFIFLVLHLSINIICFFMSKKQAKINWK